jgi:hypothetical protein
MHAIIPPCRDGASHFSPEGLNTQELQDGRHVRTVKPVATVELGHIIENK